MQAITRRDLGKYLAMGALLPELGAQTQPVASYGKGTIEPFNYSGVRLLDGMLRDQFVSARDFFQSLSDYDLLLGFRQRAGVAAPGKPMAGWYGADVFHPFGQYLGGMARMAKADGDRALMEKAAGLAHEWGKTIEPDGYFFASRKPNVFHYTYEKMVGGLVDLLEYGGRRDVVPYLERITGWAEKNLDRTRCGPFGDGCKFAANGTEWYTLCENLYRARLLTGDQRYETFGDLWRYPTYWTMFDGKTEPAPFGCHAYSHVNTLSSAAMTYAVSRDPQYLRQIRNAFDWLEKTQMYASGGYGPREHLLKPDGQLGRELETTEATFETVCGSWAGFKLSRYLMIHTGEARYGDWIEKLLYNGIRASLRIRPDGRNFYYSDYRVSGGRKTYHPNNWSCCSGTYPQVIADYHNVIYFRDAETLYVNLFVPSEVAWKRSGQTVTLAQQTGYPEAEKLEVTVSLSNPEEFTLALRVPRWCEGAGVAVNGARQPGSCTPGTWTKIRRTWKSGDRVTFELPMRPRFEAVDAQHPKRAAVVRGPVLLARRHDDGRPAAKDAAELVNRGIGVDAFQPFYRFGWLEPYEVYFDV